MCLSGVMPVSTRTSPKYWTTWTETLEPRAMAEPTRRVSLLIPCRCLTAAPDAPNSPLLCSRQRRSLAQARGACSALARRIHQPSHSDTDGVERDHRGGEKTHVQDVGGRCDNCRNNKNREYGIS